MLPFVGEPATNPPEPSTTYDCDGCGTTTLQADLYDLPRAPQGAAVFSLCLRCAAEASLELLRNPRGDAIRLTDRAVAVQALHDAWEAEARELSRLERHGRSAPAAVTVLCPNGHETAACEACESPEG